MATEQDIASAAIRAATRPNTLLGRIWRSSINFIKRKPLGAAGAFIIVFMIALAVLFPFITFFDPLAWSIREKLQAPSMVHYLGTDEMGRDLWARVVLGAQVSLMVGFGAVAMGSVSGGLLGLISAFYGGRVDAIIQRFMDALMAIPTLILALAIMAALGQSLFNVIVAVGLSALPQLT